MEHTNATRMRETVGAFMAGDMPLLLEGFAPEVLFYAPGDSPAAGTFTGREGIERFFTIMNEVSGGSLRVEVDDVLAGDRFVTIFLRITGQRHGEQMSVVVAQFAEVNPRGEWSRCWFLPDKLAEWDRFFAGATSESP